MPSRKKSKRERVSEKEKEKANRKSKKGSGKEGIGEVQMGGCLGQLHRPDNVDVTMVRAARGWFHCANSQSV
ncbi:hypothetical protein M0802_003150 [Mischocyttarus mexicanus]|nr:hypothetical protein M0802_003150 [Mischocyttarus mexicanus]